MGNELRLTDTLTEGLTDMLTERRPSTFRVDGRRPLSTHVQACVCVRRRVCT
jgi:hypothetical protein